VLLWVHRLAAPLRRATGTGRYAIELTNALTAAPAEFQLSLGSTPEAGPPDGFDATVPVRRVGRSRTLTHLAWLASRWPKIDRAAGAPALVHVLAPSFPVATRAPLVCTVHDLMPIHHPDWYGRVERLAVTRSLRLAASADAVIAVSDHVARDIAEVLGVESRRIHVVHEGIPQSFEVPPEPEVVRATTTARGLRASGYVLSVGSLSRRKNALVLVEAFAAGGAALADLTLVLAGPPGDAADALLERASALGVAERVRVLGFVPDEDLPSLMAGARLVAHPSLDEGFGLTVLESMGVGSPVVAAAAGAVPEIAAGAATLLAPESDADAWAAAMSGVPASGTDRAELVRRGRERVACFTWSRAASGTMAVWRSVLGRQPPTASS
jgi:glycosyltransferase involved in cell wall biosynthesis